MEKRINPFSNGSQYIDWENANCCKCAKHPFDEDELFDIVRNTPEKLCEIFLALSEACVGDGTISPEIAKRMAYPGSLEYCWRCGEYKGGGVL